MTASPTLPCPACHAPLDVEHHAGHYGKQVELDICHHCNALWFDKMENLALSAGGVLSLLRSMHQHDHHDRQRLPGRLSCPRCRGTLRASRRRTNNIQYTVHDCIHGDGHFITFYELLREKDCIRPLRGEKLRALRAQVQSVNCSGCGAPIDLHQTAACTHCGAPLAMLDPDAFAETLERLAGEDDRQRNPDADRIATDMVLERLKTERTFKQHDRIQGSRRGDWAGHTAVDLVALAVGALFELLA